MRSDAPPPMPMLPLYITPPTPSAATPSERRADMPLMRAESAERRQLMTAR